MRLSYLLLALFLVLMPGANAQDAVPRDLSRHDFFYAGQSKRQRMFIVKDGHLAWAYDNPQGKGEISDAVLLTDGHILLAHQ